eukprot:359053-Chlamydomonas_euryale.AAC.4
MAWSGNSGLFLQARQWESDAHRVTSADQHARKRRPARSLIYKWRAHSLPLRARGTKGSIQSQRGLKPKGVEIQKGLKPKGG